MSEQARIETAVEATIDNCELFRAQIAEQAREIELLNAEITAYEEKIAAHFQPISDEREAFMAGVKAASDKVKSILDDYDARHGSTDPDTGTREYPGSGEEWVGQMLELIEDFTGIVCPKEFQARARLGNAVVMPERKKADPIFPFDRGYNTALDEVARLNPSRGVPAVSRESCVIALRLIHRELETLANGSAIQRFNDAKAEFAGCLAAAPTPAPTVEPAHSDDVSVPRELLRTIERSWRIPSGCPESVSAEVGGIIADGLNKLRALLAGGAN